MTLWCYLRSLQTIRGHVQWLPFWFQSLSQAKWDPATSMHKVEKDLQSFDQKWFQSIPKLTVENWQNAEQEEKILSERKIHQIIYGSQFFPPALTELADPPLTLTLDGSVENILKPALSVVGSREVRTESLQWMENELLPFLRKTTPLVVSGGARGIDQQAHRMAIRAKTPTAIVIPSGLQNIYPSQLESWREMVLSCGGFFLSEYPCNYLIRKEHFHQRNRLISALGKMLLVVEGKTRSGTWLSASRAAEIGRPIFTLPGAPWDPNFRGNLELLREGATLVLDHEDLELFWQAENSESLDHNKAFQSFLDN